MKKYVKSDTSFEVGSRDKHVVISSNEKTIIRNEIEESIDNVLAQHGVKASRFNTDITERYNKYQDFLELDINVSGYYENLDKLDYEMESY